LSFVVPLTDCNRKGHSPCMILRTIKIRSIKTPSLIFLAFSLSLSLSLSQADTLFISFFADCERIKETIDFMQQWPTNSRWRLNCNVGPDSKDIANWTKNNKQKQMMIKKSLYSIFVATVDSSVGHPDVVCSLSYIILRECKRDAWNKKPFLSLLLVVQ
jgi:hypothetical protein